MTIDSERDFYGKGFAVGWLDIMKQTALFRFRDEQYEVPAIAFWSNIDHKNYHPCIPIERLRLIGKIA